MSKKPKAVILISGGLDSATTLAIAQEQGYECYALSIDYGQRHRIELKAARQIAKSFGVTEHKTIHVGLDELGGSALTDKTIAVPESPKEGIPATYVPARNTIFLSLALGWAEVIGARALFIGVTAVDYSGYPDCRETFIHAFEKAANLGTKAGAEGGAFQIHTPLVTLSKAAIIQQGIRLGVDYGLTVSCYQSDEEGRACGVCDSCRFRMQGFQEAGVADPTHYRK
ncbi:MAG: 7-cyano-7-deazaguanine synthase QueC [Candidatus Polarisedimenticolaceae bacterium]|nr:7-cyano-7-deazaguanine synthase QueC [Candidatus Polarisedimenticolaceae bacterium]